MKRIYKLIVAMLFLVFSMNYGQMSLDTVCFNELTFTEIKILLTGSPSFPVIDTVIDSVYGRGTCDSITAFGILKAFPLVIVLGTAVKLDSCRLSVIFLPPLSDTIPDSIKEALDTLDVCGTAAIEQALLAIPANAGIISSSSPNPFSGNVTISYHLIKNNRAEMTFYDLQGRAIRTYRDIAAGKSSVVWDGKDNQGKGVPAGKYICALKAGDIVKAAVISKVK